MDVLKILRFPDQRLRVKAQHVTVFDNALSQLTDNMLATMYHEHGIGLAATQVGVDKQVVVIDISEERTAPLVLINPKIIKKTGTETMQEGCLSVPDFHADVTRARQIVVEAADKHGKSFTFDADDLLAVCIQHEIDHLQGKLFIDYLSPLKRQRYLAALKKASKTGKTESRRSENDRLAYPGIKSGGANGGQVVATN